MIADRYVYMLLALYFVVLWIFGALIRRDIARAQWGILLTGAIAGPLSELWYFADYWLPPTVLGRGIPLEDVLFGVSVFGIGVLLYPLLTGKRLQTQPVNTLRRTLIMIIVILLGFLIFNSWMGINSICVASAMFLLGAIGICTIRRDLIMPSLVTGIGLAVLMLPAYVVLLAWNPQYVDQVWLLINTPLDVVVLGNIPLTEVLWYFAAGCFLGCAPQYAAGQRYQ